MEVRVTVLKPYSFSCPIWYLIVVVSKKVTPNPTQFAMKEAIAITGRKLRDA